MVEPEKRLVQITMCNHRKGDNLEHQFNQLPTAINMEATSLGISSHRVPVSGLQCHYVTRNPQHDRYE